MSLNTYLRLSTTEQSEIPLNNLPMNWLNLLKKKNGPCNFIMTVKRGLFHLFQWGSLMGFSGLLGASIMKIQICDLNLIT